MLHLSVTQGITDSRRREGLFKRRFWPGLSGQLMVHLQGSDLSFTQPLLLLSPVSVIMLENFRLGIGIPLDFMFSKLQIPLHRQPLNYAKGLVEVI